MNNNILELKNVQVRYGNIEALKGVDLHIAEAEIVALIGANGAGKSTLLKSIVGLEPLNEGEVTYNSEILNGVYPERDKKNISTPTDVIVKKGISLVPEGRGIFPEMTVKENLEMGAFLIKDKKLIEQRIEEKYEMFEILKDRRKQLAGSLSGGEQQMLAIARALMNSPKLLLLDEPALGLAPIIIQNIFQIITRINKENGVTILLVEQNARMALKISDRGYVLETGNIVMVDKSSNLLENSKVKAAYLGE
ncbi:MAG TPA: ABC transporter ATP-binding protein [Spirochaetota bacterium]|nr:ABC transporter ATP-binding protein [Spirochaetota bacterium]HOK92711.1 ABC transporter ATP-binding protein [Spirochaetota bacterium]HPP93748.1 ABC transporter ATP-binding protein [Spirochaetota bacterium]